MFSVEIRINGEMIKHIKGQNMGFVNEKNMDCIYDYQVYDVQEPSISGGTVIHNRSDGMNRLLVKILEEVEKI